jgi:HAD superfamily hydrolase (TIGR01509 family)
MKLLPSMVGRNFQDCQAIVIDRYGESYPTDALMRAWHAAYDAIVERDGIAIKHGLPGLLDWLERERVPKAVATSTRRARAQAKLVHTNLMHRFAALVGGDEIARGKPAPDIFLLAAQRLGHAPADCIVLEDSEPGIRAALAAGMTPIMVPDLHPPSDALRALCPLIAGSLADVHAHLEANGIIAR